MKLRGKFSFAICAVCRAEEKFVSKRFFFVFFGQTRTHAGNNRVTLLIINAVEKYRSIGNTTNVSLNPGATSELPANSPVVVVITVISLWAKLQGGTGRTET